MIPDNLHPQNKSSQSKKVVLALIVFCVILLWIVLLPNQSQAAPHNQVDTATFTATATPTATPLHDYLPIIIKEGGTSTPSPTPTATGTIYPNAGLTISANPTQASVNEKIVFTVKITNPGLAPAESAILSDSFPTLLNVTAATSTKGTVTRQTHAVSVSLGNIMPKEIITVTIQTQVNTSATTTQYLTNIANLTYDPSYSRNASVSYRIVGSGLPGTGEQPLEDTSTHINWSLIFLAGALGLAAIFTVWYGIWIREEEPDGSTRYYLIGALLGISALVAVWLGSGQLNPAESPLPVAYKPTATSEMVAGFAIAPIATDDTSSYSFDIPTEVSELPDFPIPSPTLHPDVTPSIQVDTSPPHRLAIPALNLDTNVKYVPFDGESWLISGLKQEIAWLGETSWPGLGGNTAMAGHVTLRGMQNGPFRYIDQLQVNDAIQVYTDEKLYTYRVRELVVVEEGDLWVTGPTENAQLTLITCTDWNDDLSLYLKRLIVFADLKGATPLRQSNLVP